MPAIDETLASLRLYGDDLDPAEVTRSLGCAPTQSWRKGDEKTPGYFRGTGGWCFATTKQRPGDLDAHIREILDSTNSDLRVWASLTKRFRVDIFCSLFMNESNEGLGLEPDLLRALGERGISLSLDVYARRKDA
jgi:hypothetical protein